MPLRSLHHPAAGHRDLVSTFAYLPILAAAGSPGHRGFRPRAVSPSERTAHPAGRARAGAATFRRRTRAGACGGRATPAGVAAVRRPGGLDPEGGTLPVIPGVDRMAA